MQVSPTSQDRPIHKLVLVYRYGLLRPTSIPETVNAQLKLAQVYYNDLVAIERKFRVAVQAALACPELEALTKEILATEQEKREPLYEKRKLLVKARRAEPPVKAQLDAAKQARKTASLAARGAIRSQSLYWGTYLPTEKAAFDAAHAKPKILSNKTRKKNIPWTERPKFKRWSGEGKLSVQIQKGLPVSELANGSFVQLRPEVPVPGRTGKPRPVLRLRVGSDERSDPIWAEWPIILHRPLPEGGVIKWVHVVRRLISGAEKWTVNLEVETFVAKHGADQRTVALDLGWRAEEVDGKPTTRAGGWTDGTSYTDIFVEPKIIAALLKVDSLVSIRDRHRNAIQSRLLDWRKSHPNLPPDHAERLRFLAQWEAARRFAVLAIWWRNNRVPGDDEMYEALEAWRKKDKHLWLWEGHTRSKALGRRRHDYRNIGKRLADQFDQLVIENLPLDELARNEPEDENRPHPKASHQRFLTAPSELRQVVAAAFEKQGKTIIEVPPGPIRTVWQRWCEGQGKVKEAKPARSKRFNRMRKIAEISESSAETNGTPPAE